MGNKKVAILGSVGVPANYGGFETLAENLVRYHHEKSLPSELTVYCSSKSYKERSDHYLSADLLYIPLHANGVQSIPYDLWGLLSAVSHRKDVILQLGVSGALALPLVRLFSSARIITNIDGIEWRRDKWNVFAKWFLHFSERLAVRFSHEIIADNAVIAGYVKETYGVDAHMIAYGGDHMLNVEATLVDEFRLPEQCALSVCRIEPENNARMIVDAFSGQSDWSLVMVGNWNHSDYGKSIRQEYGSLENIYLLDPIYDMGKLKTLHAGASLYVHGHSKGGTNPSLVEAMHFGCPIIVFDCDFNQATTENKALYFSDAKELASMIAADVPEQVGKDMLEIARRRYIWDIIANQYFTLI